MRRNHMEITAQTKLADVIKEYPWLIDEAIKMDSRFGILKTPVGKMLIGRTTVADGCKKVGCTVEEAIAKVQEMIARHNEA